ncbi:hypothetical protein K2X33_06200 [bacterium]|nr:hypothetical protein [bacterium]
MSMVPEKVKAELRRFLNAKQVEDLSKQLESYEKRVREAVKQIDVRGREAKALGQKKVDVFAAQVKRTGKDLEKKLSALVKTEGKALNKNLNDLFGYFRTLAKADKKAKKPAGKRTAAKPRKRTSAKTTKTA